MILFRNFCIFLSKIFLRFVVSLHKGLAELLANLPALPLVLDVLRQDFVCSIVTYKILFYINNVETFRRFWLVE